MESNQGHNRIPKSRYVSLAKMEQHYADRMSMLVEKIQLRAAEAILEEMTYTGEEIDDCDLFLDDLTDWLDSPFPGTGINFYDKDDDEGRSPN
tara:strand:+ start:1305 stop:1583 length:279 start_codon:yes stop_codon:yes gene_type:complete